MREQGADGTPEGVYHEGTIYLFANALRSERDIARVLFHEGLGHHGLRSVFGKSLNGVLAQVINSMPDEVEATRRRYGLGRSQEDLLHAAEEVLAYLAETRPYLSLVEELTAAIRTWLRANIPHFADLPLSKEEIIRDFVIPARRHVEHGPKARSGLPATAVTGASTTAGGGQSRAGSSPAWRLAFHGTPHRDIQRFSLDRIGTGEGAQSFGWGLYFASQKEIADHYRRVLSGSTPEMEARLKEARMHRQVAARVRARGDEPLAWEHELRAQSIERFVGQLYEVEIPDEHELLDADLPLHAQSTFVKTQLGLPETDPLSVVPAGAGYSVVNLATGDVVATNFASVDAASKIARTHSMPWMNRSGRDFYDELSEEHGSSEAASIWLSNVGIKGLMYWDGVSRSKQTGNKNFVIFDDAAITIRKAHFSRSPTRISEGNQPDTKIPRRSARPR